MFIATPITNCCKLRRAKPDLAHCAPPELMKLNQQGIYKHFIPTGFVSPQTL